jgi:hypothetical protein
MLNIIKICIIMMLNMAVNNVVLEEDTIYKTTVKDSQIEAFCIYVILSGLGYLIFNPELTREILLNIDIQKLIEYINNNYYTCYYNGNQIPMPIQKINTAVVIYAIRTIRGDFATRDFNYAFMRGYGENPVYPIYEYHPNDIHNVFRYFDTVIKNIFKLIFKVFRSSVRRRRNLGS